MKQRVARLMAAAAVLVTAAACDSGLNKDWPSEVALTLPPASAPNPCHPSAFGSAPARQFAGPLVWQSPSYITANFTPRPHEVVSDRILGLDNEGDKPLVIDRVVATGQPGVPNVVLTSTRVTPPSMGPKREGWLLAFTSGQQLPKAIGYHIPPAKTIADDQRQPDLIVFVTLPTCAYEGPHPTGYAYNNNNHLVWYHVVGSTDEYLAKYNFREVLCMPGKAPPYCLHKLPEDWPTS